ncbi:Heterodimeric geranylgeranyl pyrophosphate synthase small subunit, chloroplastic [Linum perenne]
MRYSALSQGAKRAPPVMCVAACELFGLDRLAAFPTACALEMVHAASLIHDDLPSMDNAPSRRGQPSNHAVHGVDMAILAGDALFPLGFSHIVDHTPEIARTVGSTGMAAGQFLDLNDSSSSSDTIEFIQEKKFGELGQCSAVCGGLLAGAEDDEVDMLRKYGRAVGVLYQVVNDVRKAEREEIAERKSYVGVYGVEKAMEKAMELRDDAKKALSGLEKYGDAVLPLYSFVDYAADRGFSVP